ncbi:MAG: hypothetical protein EOM72_14275 [Opitutae bacterium]|nr:hypothetical protein [Opitutae bacterium]
MVGHPGFAFGQHQRVVAFDAHERADEPRPVSNDHSPGQILAVHHLPGGARRRRRGFLGTARLQQTGRLCLARHGIQERLGLQNLLGVVRHGADGPLVGQPFHDGRNGSLAPGCMEALHVSAQGIRQVGQLSPGIGSGIGRPDQLVVGSGLVDGRLG